MGLRKPHIESGSNIGGHHTISVQAACNSARLRILGRHCSAMHLQRWCIIRCRCTRQGGTSCLREGGLRRHRIGYVQMRRLHALLICARRLHAGLG